MSNVLKALARGGAAETDPNFKQTVLLLHGDGTNGAQNNTFLDSSTNNFTITRNGNTTQGTFSPFSLAAGEWSNYFDGTGDYLTVANNAAFDFGSGDFTIEVFVYTTSTANQSCYTRLTTTGIGTSVSLVSSKWYGSVSINGTSAIAISSTDNAVPNSWNHVALTRSGTTLTLWVNGVSAGTNTVSGALHNPATTSYIGAAFPNTIVQPAIGYISNLRIVKGTAVYTSAFTPPTAPLTAITNTSLLTCQSNRFVDNSTNNFTLNRFGDVRVTPFSPFAPTATYSAGTNGGSGYFDGNTDYLTAASNAAFAFGTGDFTIEAWINPASLAADTLLCGVDVTNGAILGYSTSTVWLGSRGIAYDLTATYTLPLNSWTHIAVSRQGTTARLFANGVQIASGTVTKNYPQGQFAVGNYTAVNIGVNGYLFNVRAVKGTAVYTGAFTPPTLPLSTSGAASASAYPSTTNINTTFASSETSLLLNFTNAGILDQTGKNNLETVGNAQIDTAVKKYGTGSLEFDGTGDYLVAPSNTELTLNADFTIEGWAYLNASGNYRFLTLGDSVGSTGIEIYVGSGNWLVYSNSATRITGAAATRQVWTYLAVVRSGSTVTLYINGTASGSTWSSSASFSGRLFVGAEFFNNGITADTNGYIDDLRITKGVARYTANFTAPTKEFPDL